MSGTRLIKCQLCQFKVAHLLLEATLDVASCSLGNATSHLTRIHPPTFAAIAHLPPIVLLLTSHANLGIASNQELSNLCSLPLAFPRKHQAQLCLLIANRVSDWLPSAHGRKSTFKGQPRVNKALLHPYKFPEG